MRTQSERHHNISQFVLSNFLTCGGLVRWPRGQGEDLWLIWEGQSAESCELSVFNSDFFLSSKCHVSPQKWTSLTTPELTAWLDCHNNKKSPSPKRSWTKLSDGEEKEQFLNSFCEIQRRIEKGLLEKAVPVTFMTSPMPLGPQEHLELIQRLIYAPPELHPYGHWDSGVGFMGATPEILFNVDGHRLRTMALAGTAPLNRESGSFLNDPKERAEHYFVVKNLMDVLKPLGSFEAMATEVLKLPTLQHLKTEIGVHLNQQMSWNQLLQTMHPTAALGTYPREQWRWLRELPDQRARGPFGAPFGVQNQDGHLLCLVGIRQVQWDQQKMRIGAGCGLVKESIFEREWNELLLKIESVQRNFGWN
ncbi:MAG: chorismate-binding protein [Bdellovibrionaceae bacterium]|nr:chorismate-binding protein [Pseudobdellovibrionaceae bacterium]